MSADTITVKGLEAICKALLNARLEVLDLRVRADLGYISTEKAAELLKEIRETVNKAFESKSAPCRSELLDALITAMEWIPIESTIVRARIGAIIEKATGKERS